MVSSRIDFNCNRFQWTSGIRKANIGGRKISEIPAVNRSIGTYKQVYRYMGLKVHTNRSIGTWVYRYMGL